MRYSRRLPWRAGFLLLSGWLLAASGLGAQSPPPTVPPPPPPGTVSVAPAGVAPEAGESDLEKLRREVEALRRTQEAMRRDLAEIRRLLAGRAEGAAAPSAMVDVSGLPGRGDAGARLVVIEFSDYQCPFCARSARETVPELERTYVADGRVRYVFADHPLKIHAFAAKAAEAAHCAGEQGKLWEMHDLLFSHQTELAPERLPAHAQALGLDAGPFEACLASGRHGEMLRRTVAQAEAAGVSATPTFVVGWAEPGGSKVKVVERLRGAQPFARLQQVLDALLAQPPAGP